MRAGLLMALVLAGCGAPKPPELVVYAASSLTDAFQALGPAFEAAHPGARVTFAFAGSQTLRLQLEQGAPADVFASADARHLDALGPRLTGRHALAQNALVVVTPLDDPAGIATFADLPRARRLVVGAAEVPVGRYTAALLDRAAAQLGPAFRAGVEAAVASREANVRLVRAKVELGEADAAILYRSDVTPRLRVVPIPPALAAPTRLEQARLRDAPHPALADAWLAFTTTPAARAILARHGLGAP